MSPRIFVLAAVVCAMAAGCARGRSARGSAVPPARDTTSVPGSPVSGVVAARGDSARLDSLRRDSLRADSVTRGGEPARPAGSAGSARGAKPRAAQRQCVLDFTESPPETRADFRNYPNNPQTFIGGGLVGRCQGENSRIRADSAEVFEAPGFVNLFGNVVFDDPQRIRVTAPHAIYFTREQRLTADGGVVATQVASGSTFTGPTMEYYRAATGIRPISRLVAPGRPTVNIVEKDSAGRARPPVQIVANTIVDEGDSVLYGAGQVVITRNAVVGQSDSATYDKLTERSRLIRQARVVNSDTAQPFQLAGDTIDLFNRDRLLDRVVALHAAVATSRDLTMRAERLDMRLVDQKLDRAYASGRTRARATTPDQDLEADSIEIELPAQRVRAIRAYGRAVASAVPDTLRIRSSERDVLRGDSLLADFDSARVARAGRSATSGNSGETASAAARDSQRSTAAATATATSDSVTQPRIKELRAFGNASSYFQVASANDRNRRPAINYAQGEHIRVLFDTGAVRTVVIDSTARGVYLEPDTTATDSARADSVRLSSPDSVRRDSVRRDSLRRDSIQRGLRRPDSARHSDQVVRTVGANPRTRLRGAVPDRVALTHRMVEPPRRTRAVVRGAANARIASGAPT